MLVRSRTWTEVTLVSSWGERGDDGEVEEDEGEKDGDRDDDDGDDDIYIMMHVCLSPKIITSSWESPVTSCTPHNQPVQLRVSFDGSRLVFHGSMSVL